MGIIPNQMVKMTGYAQRDRYEKLGYDMPKHIVNNKSRHDCKKSYWIDVLDLPPHSSKEIGCICDLCEKPMKMRMADYTVYNHSGKIYCIVCGNKLFNSGENHARWNNTLTYEDRINNRKTPEYIIFTRKVLARDNYTCQICGKKGKHLDVHHLNGYSWFVEGRTDVTNGITLCSTCHDGFHGRYGKIHNTKEQFEEFFNFNLNLTSYAGILDPRRKIYCFETDILYNDVFQASEELGISISSIYSCCNHAIKSTQHKHFVYEDEYLHMSVKDKYKLIHNDTNYRIDKRIICLNTREIFKGMRWVCNKYSYIKLSNLSSHLNGKSTYINIIINGLRAVFMYYEDYINLSEDEIINKLNQGQPIPKYVCLNNLKMYYTILELEQDINITINVVELHLRDIQKCHYAGRDSTTNQPLIWMRYEDYLNATNKEIQYRLSFSQPFIICITNGITLYQYKEALKFTVLKNYASSIQHACISQSYSGKLSDGTLLKWMYYADYINLPLEKQKEILLQNYRTFEEGSFLMQQYNLLCAA